MLYKKVTELEFIRKYYTDNILYASMMTMEAEAFKDLLDETISIMKGEYYEEDILRNLAKIEQYINIVKKECRPIQFGGKMKKILLEPEFSTSTKEDFVQVIQNFIEAPEEGNDCIAVYFALPNLEALEVIVNPRVNVPTKLEYYKNVYNDNMELNVNNAVKIVGVSYL